MRTRFVRIFYHLSKAMGLFHLSRLMTRNGLRILSYHGISLDDEERFRPDLFMRREEIERRLDFLTRHRFPVLSLNDAIASLKAKMMPPCATVITIDDGFYSTYHHAFPAIRRHGFSATLYLTTYYFVKGTPIFRLVVSYMLWATRKKTVDLSGIGVPKLASTGEVDLSTPEERECLEETIIEHGETQCDEPPRCAIARQLGAQLEVDYNTISDSRILSLINAAELREMAASGIDIQLYTHRHRFPVDAALATRELEDSRVVLEPLLLGSPHHFCYADGVWSREHWSTLSANGITTATTCDPGLVYAETPLYALNRILDSSRVSQIEFEAEMYGYSELTRAVRARLRRSSKSPAASANPAQ